MSGFWNYTYCIRSDNLDLIEQALSRILELEGCRRIPLPTLSIDVEELRSCPWLLEDELWAIGLFVGSLGWTIVKMVPVELLCRRAREGDRPRLSELAMQIDSDAFYVGWYEYGGILMEVDAMGGIFISGSIGEEYLNEGNFFDQPINQEESNRFFILDVPEEMQNVKLVQQEEQNKRYVQWEEQFLEDYARRNFPLMTANKLEKWKERFYKDRCQFFQKNEGERLCEALDLDASCLFINPGFEMFERVLAQLLGGTPSYWYLGADPLVYRAYTQQQQLATDEARLLFFQPIE
ncbi:MAG: hypothetical protein PUP91_20250 [Rhizonema sp. PD37]|nr:hypothetical protein [Rhizonema sp. PD37]